MKVLAARELADRINEVLRLVEAGETIEVMNEGKVVAHLVPAEQQSSTAPGQSTAWKNLRRLSEQIGECCANNTTTIDVIKDMRG